METRARLWLKAVFWQVLGLAMMGGVGFVMTGSLRLGGSLALINTAIGLVSYVLYERVWARVGWGRQ